MSPAAAVLARVMETSHGRILAILAPGSGIAAAEDALSDALVAALRTWDATGIPDRPEAWLVAAARHALAHGRDHAEVVRRSAANLARTDPDPGDPGADDIPDRRLALLFVCAHPAIDADARTPLMLQCVLGLTAARIAAAWIASPATISQRLVRAKRRIAALGIPFAVPDRAALPDRLAHVLGAIFAAFAVGRDGGGWSDDGTVGLDTEAVALARLVVELMPDEPEARSLLALLLYATARAAAGRDAAGRFIPLDDQDPALWDRARITEAERHLINAVAGAAGAPGRFQIEAAIQSVHASRRPGEAIPWAALVGLYDILLARWPSVGAAVARLAALARLDPPEAVLVQVQTLMHGLPAPYQPAIALEADLLRRLGRHGEAGEASRRAAALALDPAVRAWLLARVPAAT